MTVGDNTAKSGPYVADGAQFQFTITYKFLDGAEIQVIQTDVSGNDTIVDSSLYTVVGAGLESGSRYVNFLTPPAANLRFTIQRDMDFKQELDLGQGDDLPSESLEEAYDKLTMMCQQLLEITERCLKISAASSTGLIGIPAPQGGYVLGWNLAGTALENIAPDTASATLAAASAALAIAAAATVNLPAIPANSTLSILRVNSASTGYDIVSFKQQVLTQEIYSNLFL